MSSKPATTTPRDGLWWLYWTLFVLCLGIGIFVFYLKREPPLTIPVLARDIPSHHILTSSDVTSKTMDARLVLTDTVRDSNILLGALARSPLKADQQISREQIIAIPDPLLISDTIAIAIPADRATIHGGALRGGDVVMVATTSMSDTIATAATLFDRVLVLDVKSEGNESVVILAIPEKEWARYLEQTQNRRVVLARKIE